MPHVFFRLCKIQWTLVRFINYWFSFVGLWMKKDERLDHMWIRVQPSNDFLHWITLERIKKWTICACIVWINVDARKKGFFPQFALNFAAVFFLPLLSNIKGSSKQFTVSWMHEYASYGSLSLKPLREGWKEEKSFIHNFNDADAIRYNVCLTLT